MKTIILPIHRIFDDVAKVIGKMPGEDTVCFGAHDWSIDEIEEIRRRTQNKLIAFQTELLYSSGTPFRHALYVEKLKLFDEIWEYSEHNIPFLKENGFSNIKYVPVRPDSSLKEEPLDKDIDVFHYGAFTRHRVDLVNRIIREGFDLTDALLPFREPLYDEELHRTIRRSKVVLGIHSHPQCPIQESVRYQYPLSNDIPVLGEKSLSNPLNIEEFDGEDDMVEKLKRHVTPKFDQGHIRENMLQLCSWYLDYIDEAKHNLDHPGVKETVRYAFCSMEKDKDTIASISKYPERAKDVDDCEWMVFYSLLEMWVLVQENRSCFAASEYAVIKRQFKKMYSMSPRRLLKKRYKSQKGRIMPRLRRILLLHGWFVCKTSLDVLSVFHYDKKLIGDSFIVPTS